MKRPIFFIVVILPFLFCSCKKNTDEPKEEPDHFSFVYNSATYNYSITNNISSGGVLENDNTLGIFIDMPAVFGGSITFSYPTCAYMEPPDTAIYDDGSCNLSIRNSFGDLVPVDSTDIFIYQSGSLNISLSNCVIKTERNPITGETNQFQECIASGTFDLTLVNRNNEIIKITNGIVSFHVIR